MAIIVCKNCGKKLSDRAPRCPHCGDVRTNENQTPQTPQTPQPPQPPQQPQQHQPTGPKPPTQQPPSTPTQSSAKAGGRLNSTHVIIIIAALVVGIGIGVAAISLTREDNEVQKPEPIEASYSTTDDGEEQHIEADEFQPDAAAAEEDFIWLSDSSITLEDIIDHGYDNSDLRLLRNAIFARHGYRFKSQDLQEYFSQFSWYIPRFDDVTSHLSEVERENIKFLKSLEQ